MGADILRRPQQRIHHVGLALREDVVMVERRRAAGKHEPGKARSRRGVLGLAVEPMTCPPDAFTSSVDLVRLAPGESHTASWTIAAIA